MDEYDVRDLDDALGKQDHRAWQGLSIIWHLVNGLVSYPLAIAAALVTAWTGFTAALLLAAVGGVVGAVVALFLAIQQSVGATASAQGVSGSVDFFAMLGGGLVGALSGFLYLVGGSLTTAPGAVLRGLIAGGLISVTIAAIANIGEPLSVRLRGYRRPSWEEWEQRLRPLFLEVADAAGYRRDLLPRIRIADTDLPRAWAYARVIVLSRGLLNVLEDDELAGVLVHELYHCMRDHIAGQRLVWAAAFPLVILYEGVS